MSNFYNFFSHLVITPSTKCPSSAQFVGKNTHLMTIFKSTFPILMKIRERENAQCAKQRLQAAVNISIIQPAGEFVETVHFSLRRYEETHGTKIVGKKGTPQHLIQSQTTKDLLTGYNSRRAGFSPAYEMTMRKKKSPQSPLVQSIIDLK